MQTFQTAVGDPIVLQPGFRTDRILDFFRLSGGDTWSVHPRLTVNGGLGWSVEPNALNHDLTKPALLAPILGAGRLNAVPVQWGNISATMGFWLATRDGRTVVRGGAGRYFDPDGSNNGTNLANERRALLPLGAARLIRSGANIPYGSGTLQFQRPTSFTGAELFVRLPEIRAVLGDWLSPGNRDFSVRNVDLTKEGNGLRDPDYRTPSALHLAIGVQHELPHGIVAGADAVWKQFSHTFINGIDYNRWRSGNPVIRACLPEEKMDVTALCSNGSLFFDTTSGRARYAGLLVRIEKRYARGYQFLASYALGSYVGTNGTGTGTAEATGGRVFGFNNDNWFENYGPLPTDVRHILNVSGIVDLPWQLQLGVNLSASSRPPFSVHVALMDFNGDGTINDLLPGTKINQFGRGLDKKDLARLVADYNRQNPNRQPLSLPPTYAFDDNFFCQDLRLSRDFRLGPGTARLLAFAEVFNLFNTANLTGYSGNLTSRATFGQPTARFTQVFGSGGPRAFQFGARVGF
jgi:hypothetical protein